MPTLPQHASSLVWDNTAAVELISTLPAPAVVMPSRAMHVRAAVQRRHQASSAAALAFSSFTVSSSGCSIALSYTVYSTCRGTPQYGVDTRCGRMTLSKKQSHGHN